MTFSRLPCSPWKKKFISQHTEETSYCYLPATSIPKELKSSWHFLGNEIVDDVRDATSQQISPRVCRLLSHRYLSPTIFSRQVCIAQDGQKYNPTLQQQAIDRFSTKENPWKGLSAQIYGFYQIESRDEICPFKKDVIPTLSRVPS